MDKISGSESPVVAAEEMWVTLMYAGVALMLRWVLLDLVGATSVEDSYQGSYGYPQVGSFLPWQLGWVQAFFEAFVVASVAWVSSVPYLAEEMVGSFVTCWTESWVAAVAVGFVEFVVVVVAVVVVAMVVVEEWPAVFRL